MITLYDNAFSPFARKVRMVLEHKGIAHEVIDALSHRNREALAAVNGRVEVPALRHNDVVVVNSSDIVAYLERVFPDRPVYPTADVTCDGNRRTIILARSGNVGDRIVATYAVSPKVSEGMLRAAECRLMFPGREIPLARQQIRTAWAGYKAAK